MGFNKSKALEEAAGLVSQRKLSQAIRQYQVIVEQDPQDLLLHNIIGDLWVREGNIPEAIREFHTLADAYAREGFILKAIAIYRKIVKLDPQSLGPLIKLAELYAGQKLSHEANELHMQALTLCERHSLGDQASQILRKLVAQEPGNAAYRVRQGEFFQNSGQPQEACQAFLEAAELSYYHKDMSAAALSLMKAAEIEPQRPEILLWQARMAAEAKNYDEVIGIFHKSPTLKSSREGRSLLLSVYFDSQRLDEAAQLAVEACRTSPEGFKTVAQFSARCLQAGNPDAVLRPLHEIADLVFQRNQARELLDLLQQVLTAGPLDPASLDLIASLCERAKDEENPSQILEALGKAFAQTEQWARAEKVFRRLAVRDERNTAWQSLLKESIEEQGLEARTPPPPSEVSFVPPPGADEALSPPPPVPLTGEVSERKYFQEETQPPVIAASLSTQPSIELEALPAGKVIEVDFLDEWESFAQIHPIDPESPPQSVLPSPPLPQSESAAPEPKYAAVNQELTRLATRKNLAEEKGQVEFYLNYGFFGEASASLKNLYKKYPGYPQLGELQKRLDALAAAQNTDSRPTTASPAPVGSVMLPPAADPENISDRPVVPSPIQPRHELAGSTDRPISPVEPQPKRESLLDDLAHELANAFDEAEKEAPPSFSVGPARDDTGAAHFHSSMEELLSELEAGPEVSSDDDSPQTHYNLGVAFREMGLLDEAIGEFQKVVKGRGSANHSPGFLEAISLLGICFMEKQMPEIAVRWYLRALQAPGLDEETSLALNYDLGIAYEQCGNAKAAQEKFSEVYSLNIDYRDVAEKLQLLRPRRA